ncbi:MAG: anti-sigma factor family protein [Candidatus Polarisedimenticolia bacterium]
MKRRARAAAGRTIRECRDVIDLLTEYMEGDLRPDEARRLQEHLASCSACAEFLETLEKTRAAVGGLRSREVPEPCRLELRAFLQKELADLLP